MRDIVLSVKDLSVGKVQKNTILALLHHISFHLEAGHVHALVGESGSGKSMIANTIMGLLPEDILSKKESHIYLENTIDLLNLPEIEMRKYRGRKISMIFQEPMSALNPVMKIAEQIREILVLHKVASNSELKETMLNLLREVGLDEKHLQYYPHQLSGGMRQRVVIAMALAATPDIIIADEPTTAVDAITQKQILDLLVNLTRKNKASLLFITHDIKLVSIYADAVSLIYYGEIVEIGAAKSFLAHPLHPYAIQLLASEPSYEKRDTFLPVIAGHFPPIGTNLPGCIFAPRCHFAESICYTKVPDTYYQQNRQVKCHLYAEKGKILSLEGEQKSFVPAASSSGNMPLLIVKNVCLFYTKWDKQKKLAALENITFHIQAGECFALIGCSGSGKTTLARAITGLQRLDSGKIFFQEFDLTKAPFYKKARLVQLIFQDPFNSLNPKLTVQEILSESFQFQSIPREKKIEHMIMLLEKVGLSADILNRFSHEFSGGQRQRIAIARAIAMKPLLLICDEPTSALDISVQAQILNLLKRLQKEYKLTILLITHNFSVVSYLADRAAVMQKGKIIEMNDVEKILKTPQMPYTRQLIEAAYL